jgi:hypothetical protein
VTSNIVNINGDTTVLGNVVGGHCLATTCSNDLFSGNTLNVKTPKLETEIGTTGNNATGDLSNFEHLNFFYQPDMLAAALAENKSFLKLTGTATLSGTKADGNKAFSTVYIGIAGAASPLRAGDRLTLIEATADDKLKDVPATATGRQGTTIQYGAKLYNDAGRLLYIVDEAGANEESKSLSEGYLSGTAFLGQGSDFLLSQGMNAAQDAFNDSVDRPQIFATLDYGSLRYHTGSRIAIQGHHLIAGVALGHRFAVSRLTTAIFLEYGDGDHDTANRFASGKVKGSGNVRYQGVGLLARSDFDDGMYLEGSVRGGEVDIDYRTNDLWDYWGHRVSVEYATKNGYVGAHLGIGKTWVVNETDSLDTHVQGLWTRQGSETATITTGEVLEFDRIESRRLRFGVRYEHALSGGVKAYAGLGYDREFSGKARATTQGYRIDVPKLKGDTGIVELGLRATPRPGQPLHLDFGLRGYAGKREGATGNLRMSYSF